MPQENEKIISSNFDALASTEWAITEAGLAEVKGNYRSLPQMVAALDKPKALEAYRAEYLENTLSVRVRDGVAIIPVTGPIFANFSWYMYFYGGTCLSFLMKDIQACIDNPNVYAILFKVDTPGGQVVGVNEASKFIRDCRARIPMTVFVEGYMCSAGLWLGVQAGDVVVDETSYVGSLGVCTSYIDDRKFMDKVGFTQIDIISSQSPYKNLPPYKDNGLAVIQARVDYLAERFGEAVAIGRDLPIGKVWEKFGKGDVLIGQQAIDAGAADRIGTQEECLELLAKTHAPHLFTGRTDEDSAREKTLNFQEKVNSEFAEEKPPVLEAEDDSRIQSKDETNLSKEEIMPEENKQNPAPGADAAATGGNSAAPAPAAAAASTPATAGEQFTPSAAEFADMKRLLNEANQKLDTEAAARQDAEAKTARIELEGRMKNIAAEFAGNDVKVGDKTVTKESMLVALAEKFGEESAEFKAYVEDQKATKAQLAEGGLFKEKGATGAADSGSTVVSAHTKLAAEAKKIVADEKMSYDAAFIVAAERNPAIYSEYQAELER